MKLTPTVAERIVTAVETSHIPLCRIADYCEITLPDASELVERWRKLSESD